MCSTVPGTDTTKKLYTRKEILLLETSIKYFHEKFYIIEIQELEFNFLYVNILGTHNCGKELLDTFKFWVELHDVCVNVITQNDWYIVFITKSNQNNMVEIYWCILKELN